MKVYSFLKEKSRKWCLLGAADASQRQSFSFCICGQIKSIEDVKLCTGTGLMHCTDWQLICAAVPLGSYINCSHWRRRTFWTSELVFLFFFFFFSGVICLMALVDSAATATASSSSSLVLGDALVYACLKWLFVLVWRDSSSSSHFQCIAQLLEAAAGQWQIAVTSCHLAESVCVATHHIVCCAVITSPLCCCVLSTIA